MKVNSGFTLVEMAIVILVIGLLLRETLRPLSIVYEQKRFEQTDRVLEDIKEALLGYAILHQRLPCPASSPDTGIENLTLCNKEGYLPWADLGLGRYDGWGNPFRYRAEEEYTGNGNHMDYAKIIVDEDKTGSGLNVRRGIYDSAATTEYKWFTKTTDDSRVAAIIFSCGQNGRPDPTPGDAYPDKVTNDADKTGNSDIFCTNPVSGTQSREYVSSFIVKTGGENLFDDRLTWLSRNTLLNRLLTAKRWPQ